MAERAVAVKMSVRDQETVLEALRATGREAEAMSKKFEAANQNVQRGNQQVKLSNEQLGQAFTNLAKTAATGQVSLEGLKGSAMALAGTMGGPLGAVALVGALTGAIFLAGKAFEALQSNSLAAKRALETASNALTGAHEASKKLADSAGTAAEKLRIEAQANIAVAETEKTRLEIAIQAERVRYERGQREAKQGTAATVQGPTNTSERIREMEERLKTLNQSIVLARANISAAEQASSFTSPDVSDYIKDREGKLKKTNEQSIASHKQFLEQIKKLEDEAAAKSEVDKFRRIDAQYENELKKYREAYDKKIITLAEFARAETAITRKAEAEKQEMMRETWEKLLEEGRRANERAAQEALKPWEQFGDDLSSIFVKALQNGFRFDRGAIERSVFDLAGGLANRQFVNPLLSGFGLTKALPGSEQSPLYKFGTNLGSGTFLGFPMRGQSLSADQVAAAQAGANALGTELPAGYGQPGIVDIGLGAIGGAATGFSLGNIVGGIIPGLNQQNSALGGTIGGGIGAIAGSFIPVIGTMLGGLIGSVAGSLFGGLFGPKKPSVGPGANAALSHRDGRVYVQGVGADNGGDAGAAGEFGKAMAEAMNRTAEHLGSGVRAGGVYAAVTPAGFRTGIGTSDLSSSKDAEQAIKQGIFQMLRQPGRFFDLNEEQTRVVGLSKAENLDQLLSDLDFAEKIDDIIAGILAGKDELKAAELAAKQAAEANVKALKEFYDKANELGFTDKAEQGLAALVEQMLNFTANPEQVTESAKALAALAKNFEVLRDNAEDLHITEQRIAQAEAEAKAELRRGFDEGIAQQILQIIDPVAAALAEFDKVAAARVREAETLGADLVEVERLNMLARKEVIERAGGGVNASLQQLMEEVMFGPLGGAAPGVALEGRRASFEAAAAQAMAGDFTARARLPDLARSFLESSRGYFASSQGFQDDRERVLAVVSQLIGSNDNVVVEAINSNGIENVRLLTMLFDELAALRAVTVEQAATIASMDARLARQG